MTALLYLSPCGAECKDHPYTTLTVVLQDNVSRITKPNILRISETLIEISYIGGLARYSVHSTATAL